MTRRWALVLALGLSLACASGPGVSPRPPGPAPRNGAEPVQPEGVDGEGPVVAFRESPATRYTILSLDSVITEYPDGATQVRTHLQGAKVTLRTTELDRGQLQLDIALDSVWVDTLTPMTQAVLDSARGTHWNGLISPDGHVFSLRSDRPSTLGEHFLTVFARLFPVLPGAGAADAGSWQDSISRDYELLPSLDAQETVTAEYRTVAWEGSDSTRALRIESVSDYEVEGAGTQFGQWMTVEGGGTAIGQHVMSLDGRLVRAEVTDSARLTITLPDVGQTVPMTIRGHYSLQRLP